MEGFRVYGVSISGNTSISAKGTNLAMHIGRFTVKDKYKVDMGGNVYLENSYQVCINFENIDSDSCFILTAPEAKGALICEDMPEVKAKFNVPAEVSVIAGDSEENAKFIKIACSCNISFDTDGGSGTMDAGKCIEGCKHTLPNCTFTYSGSDSGGGSGGGAIAPKKQSGTWIKDNVGKIIYNKQRS